MARLLVCGDRKWLKRYFKDGTLDHKTIQHVKDISFDALDYFTDIHGFDTIMEGCAPGADRMAELWSESRHIREHIHFPADWHRYPKAAGPIRNEKMRDEGKPDKVLAFHDDIENSKGTRHMVKIAKEANIPVLVLTTEMLEEMQHAIR